jgi:hypothetical protein
MEDEMASDSNSPLGTGVIQGSVTDASPSKNPVVGARLVAFGPIADKAPTKEPTGVPSSAPVLTDADGYFIIDGLQPGFYWVSCDAFGPQGGKAVAVAAEGMTASPVVPKGTRAAAMAASATSSLDFPIPFGLSLIGQTVGPGGTRVNLEPGDRVRAGTNIRLLATIEGKGPDSSQIDTGIRFASSAGAVAPIQGRPYESVLHTDNVAEVANVTAILSGAGGSSIVAAAPFDICPAQALPVTGELGVTLRRTSGMRTSDQVLWSLIRNRTGVLSFNGYRDFINKVLCEQNPTPTTAARRELIQTAQTIGTQAYGMAAYELLKTATEVFLLLECGTLDLKTPFNPANRATFEAEEESRLGERVTLGVLGDRLREYFGPGRLPYLTRVIAAAFPGDTGTKSIFCPHTLTSRASAPCLLELIWSYWTEEGMLVQTMNAISRRFQNVRGPGDRDPLAHLEIDPLRPLNNLLWGYVQDEQNLLTVKRRAYEYDHHYGLATYGKAVPPLRPADTRSKFLEGFHNLLHLTSVFYKEDNDTTVIADGFPLLNALREVHLLLAQGAHNQFGDLPWTARAEMLVQQWLLARPEMREFLQSRPMVPYKEPWMSQVDTMKTLQGWTDVTVTHFRDLGTYGEQILLSMRYGDWIDINDEDSAKNWARYWRPEIQSYIHAYRIVTGVDLTNPDTVDYTLPAMHLQKRLALQRAR